MLYYVHLYVMLLQGSFQFWSWTSNLFSQV